MSTMSRIICLLASIVAFYVGLLGTNSSCRSTLRAISAKHAVSKTNMSCQVVMFVDMKLRISFRTTWSLRKTEAVPLHSLHLDQYHGKSGNQTWLAGKTLISSMYFPFKLPLIVVFPAFHFTLVSASQSTGIPPDPRSSTWTIRVP